MTPDLMAELFASLGGVEEFFKWIEAALKADPLLIAALRYDPMYDSVRTDPRFTTLFQRMGFKP